MTTPLTNTGTMSLCSMPGTRVTYSFPSNGQKSDQRTARDHLCHGQQYTVKQVYVGSWKSYVELEEVPGVRFNSVHFSA